jgi:hypothetical protein
VDTIDDGQRVHAPIFFPLGVIKACKIDQKNTFYTEKRLASGLRVQKGWTDQNGGTGRTLLDGFGWKIGRNWGEALHSLRLSLLLPTPKMCFFFHSSNWAMDGEEGDEWRTDRAMMASGLCPSSSAPSNFFRPLALLGSSTIESRSVKSRSL